MRKQLSVDEHPKQATIMEAPLPCLGEKQESQYGWDSMISEESGSAELRNKAEAKLFRTL